MNQHLEHAEDILGFVLLEARAGRACALGIVTGVSGGSARAVGTLLAVSSSGEMAGYVSNGCIDADLRLQALAALETGEVRTLRYGAGSPFVDLRLPCGGSVTIVLDPLPDPEICRQAHAALTSRRPVTIHVSPQTGLEAPGRPPADSALARCRFSHTYSPRLRLVAAGRGAPLVAVAGMARAMAIPALAMSPDAQDGDALELDETATFAQLRHPQSLPELSLDAWTAALCLFHAHEWEEALLTAALESRAFFIGALGSRRTQRARLTTLRAAGYSENALARITGPIGLIASARDAHTLAISALAQIVQDYRTATNGRLAANAA